jgi:predicted ATPase
LLVEETGERYVEVEIHRLQGNLLLARNGSAEAEACYVRALEVARAQEARSFELRAAGELARLWAGHGESKGAPRQPRLGAGSRVRVARKAGMMCSAKSSIWRISSSHSIAPWSDCTWDF